MARPAGFSWEQTERTGDEWVTHDVGSPWSDALNAIEANDAVHVRPGRTVDMTVAEDLLPSIARAITPRNVAAEDGTGWPQETFDRWTEYRDWLTVNIPHKEVWAKVNGAELLIYTPDGATEEWPVLFLGDEDRFLGLNVLAESSWFSESDGAPVSWSGGSHLYELFPGVLMSETWGDDPRDSLLIHTAGASDVGRAIADFILADRQQFMAAWNMENFGAEQSVTPEVESEWAEIVNGLDLSLTLNFTSEGVREACRQHLNHDVNYSGFAEAIRSPESEIGQNLLSLLRDVAETGTTARLMSEDWW